MLGPINNWAIPIRWPIKWVLFLLATLLILHPRLDLLVKMGSRYQNPNALIDPDSPALQPLLEEFRQKQKPDWDRPTLLKKAEQFVYEKIPYEWDWNLWWNADYFPTVEEAIRAGKEDCDGRAIVAASLLRRLGFKAHLVSDLGHVWVNTDQGETMGPGKTRTVEFKEEGMQINWLALARSSQMISYGISVFPLWRELLITAVAWMLLIGRGVRWSQAFVWLAVLVVGLMFVREGGEWKRQPGVTIDYVGYGVWFMALIGLMVQARRAISRSMPSRNEVLS